MNNIKKYLTTRNVLSWPVIVLTAAYLIFANLVDTSTNGLGHVTERVTLVLGTQGLYLLTLYVCDVLFLRSAGDEFRWLFVWITVAILGIARAMLLSVLWVMTGLATELALFNRVAAGLINFGMLMVLIAVAYGMLREAATQRNVLEHCQQQLIAMRYEASENRIVQNNALLDRVRSRLADALALEKLDTAENTVALLQASVDEVIRPLSRTLNERTAEIQSDVPHTPTRIQIRQFLRRMMDVRELAVLPGVVMFILLMLTPLSNVLGSMLFPVIALIMAIQLWLTTWLLKWLLIAVLPALSRWLSFIVLLISAAAGSVLFVNLMPTELRISFLVGYIGVYFFCSVVPVALRVAVEELRLLSLELEMQNSNLRWDLARSNEVAQQQNRIIATALHGRLQAALTAAVFRLQIALREGKSSTEALSAARHEAEKAVEFDVDFEESPRPISETIVELADLWHGVCEVRYTGETSVLMLVDSDPVCARLCSELLIELCTNAIKHGHAHHVEISFEISNERILIVSIVNDGDEPKNLNSGYGTELLNQSCIDWEQAEEAGLIKVTAQVPYAPRSE